MIRRYFLLFIFGFFAVVASATAFSEFYFKKNYAQNLSCEFQTENSKYLQTFQSLEKQYAKDELFWSWVEYEWLEDQTNQRKFFQAKEKKRSAVCATESHWTAHSSLKAAGAILYPKVTQEYQAKIEVARQSSTLLAAKLESAQKEWPQLQSQLKKDLDQLCPSLSKRQVASVGKPSPEDLQKTIQFKWPFLESNLARVIEQSCPRSNP